MDGNYFLLIAFIFIFTITYFIKNISHKLNHQRSRLESCYKKRDLLTKAEWKFYTALKEFIGEDFVITMKVRLADIIESENKKDIVAFRKIMAKHLDFVIVNKDSASVICCIELDDKSHQRPNRKVRDQFLECALASAEVPLVRVPVRSSYDESYIANYFSTWLSTK